MADGAGPPVPPTGAAFLLSQLGAHATSRFTERVAAVGLTPAQAGLLRLVMSGSVQSQGDAARALGVASSKVVGLVDDLETRGILQRRRSSTDRRNQELHLTDAGRELVTSLRAVARDHEQDVTSALSSEQREQLIGLLQTLVVSAGLTPGAHPGYRDTPGRRPAG